jgi:hypothetical protein
VVLAHPFVIGERALANLRQGEIVLKAMADLPHANVATEPEVLHFIEHHALSGRGIGSIDAHLLAAVKLTPATKVPELSLEPLNHDGLAGRKRATF